MSMVPLTCTSEARKGIHLPFGQSPPPPHSPVLSPHLYSPLFLPACAPTREEGQPPPLKQPDKGFDSCLVFLWDMFGKRRGYQYSAESGVRGYQR